MFSQDICWGCRDKGGPTEHTYKSLLCWRSGGFAWELLLLAFALCLTAQADNSIRNEPWVLEGDTALGFLFILDYGLQVS